VAEPRTYLDECHRVLRPGGRLLLSTHGIMTYHRDPDDYWRWTGAGLRREMERAGFEVLRMEGIMGLTAAGLQLTLDGIHYRLPRPLAAAVALLVQGLIALVDRFESDQSLADNALVYAVIAQRPSRRE
jgi:SAM-dependent methyltransferase